MTQEKKRSKETFISLGLAAILIAVGVTVLGGFLHYAVGSEEGAITQDFQEASSDIPSSEPQAPAGLNTIVYMQGNTLPEGAVSAQYAIALTSEIAERAYGKPLTGRVFCQLRETERSLSLDYYEIDTDFIWDVSAEYEGGFITVEIDPMTGVDFQAFTLDADMNNWAKDFDEWNEDTAEQERLESEARIAEAKANPDPDSALQPIPEDQLVYIHAEKARGLKEWIATMVDSPYGAQAVEAVNRMGLGNGAQATQGIVSMIGSRGGDDYTSDTGGKNAGSYMIDVVLDNGKHLVVEFITADATIAHYERHSVSFLSALYGPENA